MSDYATQTNVREGDIQVIANEDLSSKEGFLAVLCEDTNVLEARLPDYVYEPAMFVIVEGAAAGSYATLRPLDQDQSVRIELEGTCNPGDVLKLYTIDATNDGKVATLGATAGIYFSPGIAEEEGVDGQLVRVRPLPRLVSVASAHVADPAAPAAATSHTITDNSTGTPSTTEIAEITNSANAGSADLAPVENAIATLAAELVLVKADLEALRTGIANNNSAIDSINTALAEQKVTAAS